MHIIMTVNAAWNIWNFRRPLVEALKRDGHRITVLAPPDDAVPELERLGCRVRPLKMSVKGLNPLEDLKLQHRFGRIKDALTFPSSNASIQGYVPAATACLAVSTDLRQSNGRVAFIRYHAVIPSARIRVSAPDLTMKRPMVFAGGSRCQAGL